MESCRIIPPLLPRPNPKSSTSPSPPRTIPGTKRRSLKVRKTTALKPADGAPEAARELAKEAPAFTAAPAPAKPEVIEKIAPAPVAEVVEPKPAPAPRVTGYAGKEGGPRLSSTSTPSTSPHGTRPATLYYTTGPRKEKETPAPAPVAATPAPAKPAAPEPAPIKAAAPEPAPVQSTPEPTPMKTTPLAKPVANPKPVAPASPSFGAPTGGVRPTSVADYRTNVERQAREQKSVGSILSYVVYVLIGFFVLGAGLAFYGGNVLYQRLQDQSVTVGQLDSRLSGETKILADQNQVLDQQLKLTMSTIVTAQAQIVKQQEVIAKQQESIAKLTSNNQDLTSALRTERQTRSEETSALRSRVRKLENQSSNSQRN